jgi:hypothetical protein
MFHGKLRTLVDPFSFVHLPQITTTVLLVLITKNWSKNFWTKMTEGSDMK